MSEVHKNLYELTTDMVIAMINNKLITTANNDAAKKNFRSLQNYFSCF